MNVLKFLAEVLLYLLKVLSYQWAIEGAGIVKRLIRFFQKFCAWPARRTKWVIPAISAIPHFTAPLREARLIPPVHSDGLLLKAHRRL